MVGRVPEVTCPHRRPSGDPSPPLPLRRPKVVPAFRGGPGASTHREGSTMNWTNIENGWNEYKASAKKQWTKLSDPQLTDTLGRRELLVNQVQEVYALSEEETERQVAAWQAKQFDKQAPAAKS